MPRGFRQPLAEMLTTELAAGEKLRAIRERSSTHVRRACAAGVQ